MRSAISAALLAARGAVAPDVPLAPPSAAPLTPAPVEDAAPAVPEDVAASLRAEGAAAERTRILGILSHEAAADRPDLARHLAFRTDHTAESASGILEAAPKAQAAASHPLASAMAKMNLPEPPLAAGSDDSANAAAQRADSAIANWKAATGRTKKGNL